MSGPKVIVIVTREEIEAICRAHMAQVDAAIARVTAALKKYDILTEDKIAGLEKQRTLLKQSLAADRFMEIQKLAPALIDFCTAELTKIEEKAVKAAEFARNRGRQLADAARGIIELREGQKLPVGDDLKSIVRGASNASASELDRMQATLDAAVREVTKAATTLSKDAQRLAGRLASGQAPTSLQDWLVRNPIRVDEKEQRLDKVLAELRIIAAPEVYDKFATRAASIMGEAARDRRALLTDSLIMEAAAASAHAKDVAKLRLRLEALHSELATLPGETKAALNRIEAAAMAEPEELKIAIDNASAFIAGAKRELAAKARRKAVLEGLATLGYEVREGMATAWAKDGKIVVRKAGETDYGVQLSAPGDLSKLQVQLVGSDQPASPRDKTRDRDREISWCSDLDSLKSLFASAGGEISLAHAVAPGDHPVKTVPSAVLAPEYVAGQLGDERPKTRTL
jgi:hypothetical protein